MLNVMREKRRHRLFLEESVSLHEEQGLHSVLKGEQAFARWSCSQMSMAAAQTHGRAPWFGFEGVSCESHRSAVSRPALSQEKTPCSEKRGSVHMAVFLFRLQTHPSLIDSTCFRDWCPFSPFPSWLNRFFEFKNLDITTPTGSWESA